MNDEVVGSKVLRKIRSAHDGHFKAFTETGTQATGNLLASDVFGKRRMRTGFGNEHPGMRRQAVDGFRSLDELLDVALVASHQYGKRRQQALFGLVLPHLGKNL